MYSLTDLCSLCLINSKTITSVLSQDNDGIVVKNKLEYVLFEIINFKSETLKNICTDCLKGLNYVYKFKQKCLQNLTSLNEYIEKLSDDIEEFHYFQPTSDEVRKQVTTGQHFISNVTQQPKDKDELMETTNYHSLCQTQIQENKLQGIVKKEPENDYYNDSEMQYETSAENISKAHNLSNTECNSRPQKTYENQSSENNVETVVKQENVYIHENIDIKYNPSISDEEDDSRDASNEATNSEESPSLASLPEKSKERYEHVYQQFELWCTEKNVQAISEEILLAYFEEKASKMKSSTLWSIFSMLRATLMVKRNIEIKKFSSLLSFIKNKSIGHQSKTTSVLIKSDIEKFLKEADDSVYLLMKVVLIIGISGACRREELTYLQLDSMKDMGAFILIDIPHSNKTNVRREFMITSGSIAGVDLLGIVRKYHALRPTRLDNTRFFLGYRGGKCTRQSVGINTIGAVPRKIAEFLQLPNPVSYTGNCFRRSAATLLTDARGDGVVKRRRGRWKMASC